MEKQTNLPDAKRRNHLPMEMKERFISYFMNRYSGIRRIKIGRNNRRAMTARARYNDGRTRTFEVSAYTYEGLVIAMQEAFSHRGVLQMI